jgi:hypothetical protein
MVSPVSTSTPRSSPWHIPQARNRGAGRLVAKAFSHQAMTRWEGELVGKLGNELIDQFATRGTGN